MRHAFSIAIAAILFSASASGAASRCVLPVADGSDIEPSPASLAGRLVRVGPGEVLVHIEGVKKPVRVLVSASTELFTAYGGGVEPKDLHPGQHAIIWYKNCVAPRRATPVAAVLELCSLAPEPCAK